MSIRSAFRIVALASSVALVACGGDKSSSSAAAGATASATPAPATDTAPAPVAAVASMSGEQAFARCATCHQATGQGVTGAFPPLAGSEWVNGKVDVPIAIVLHGLQGPITVKGATYQSMMMAYGTAAPMSDADVAAVLTYVRSSWGNSASAVTPEDVARVRAATSSRTTPWTVAELEALK